MGGPGRPSAAPASAFLDCRLSPGLGIAGNPGSLLPGPPGKLRAYPEMIRTQLACIFSVMLPASP
ncbi:hypothetical protein D7X33_06890 [Butyricicoccus sp. 1XD8-22]|nr:hypothetical protein D7X33_06890 [Butyricicoccus sp. 1XD8-22]